MTLCSCGSNINYMDCCGRFISGKQLPTTPEALMRSRYTAYTQGNIGYITQTMTGPAAVNFNVNETKAWAQQITWIRLEVLNTAQDNIYGTVEFRAHYLLQHKNCIMHEVSEFECVDGKWYYTNSKFHETVFSKSETIKVGRNDPCTCGSGKKYKKCCASSK